MPVITATCDRQGVNRPINSAARLPLTRGSTQTTEDRAALGASEATQITRIFFLSAFSSSGASLCGSPGGREPQHLSVRIGRPQPIFRLGDDHKKNESPGGCILQCGRPNLPRIKPELQDWACSPNPWRFRGYCAGFVH